MRIFRTVGVAALSVLALGCGEVPDEAPPAEDSPPISEADPGGSDRLPLKAIMTGLAADMSGVANGLWVSDDSVVAAAAGRIADHPRVPPDQMEAIQAELGEAFPDFVTHDRTVHDAAVELAEAASAGHSVSELVEPYHTLVDGCVGCHAAFRDRLVPVLAPASDQGS